MDDREYYLGQMEVLNQNINNYGEEKNKYGKILGKIEQLQGILKNINESLIKIEKNFEAGGFISNNETFDKGCLKKDSNMLDKDILSIDLVIANVKNKIKLLENNIIECQSKYKVYANKVNGII